MTTAINTNTVTSLVRVHLNRDGHTEHPLDQPCAQCRVNRNSNINIAIRHLTNVGLLELEEELT